MKSMKDMKISILHALHVLHGLKIKFAQVISCMFLNGIDVPRGNENIFKNLCFIFSFYSLC